MKEAFGRGYRRVGICGPVPLSREDMASYIVQRLLFVTVGLLIVSFGIFMGVRFAPMDPADTMIPGGANEEETARIHEKLGLNKPILIQYVQYVGGIFLRGDFGESYYSGEPVTRLLVQRIPVSFTLVLPAFAVIMLVGIPTGFIAALYRNSPLDYTIVSGIYILQALPSFWVAIVLIMVLSVKLRLFPSFGRGGIETMVLPTIALATPLIGRATRFVRTGLLEVMEADYIRTAFSKGVSRLRVYWRHAFRNALIPLVTDSSQQFVWTMGNAIVIEEIFAWSGVGRLTISSIRLGDYPTAQGCVLFFAALFMVTNLLVDLSYTFLDPRIEFG